MGDSRWASEGLVIAAQEGDAAAISALVSSSHPHVQRFAHSLCASPQDAEDAAQEALIILYRKIGSLRATAALSSWMFRIVRNECLRRSRSLLSNDIASFEPVAMSVEDHVVRRLEAERVAAAVAALSDDLRRVLVMRDVQGYPGLVVADALGLSTTAMKSRLHRARAALHDMLEEEAPT